MAAQSDSGDNHGVRGRTGTRTLVKGAIGCGVVSIVLGFGLLMLVLLLGRGEGGAEAPANSVTKVTSPEVPTTAALPGIGKNVSDITANVDVLRDRKPNYAPVVNGVTKRSWMLDNREVKGLGWIIAIEGPGDQVTQVYVNVSVPTDDAGAAAGQMAIVDQLVRAATGSSVPLDPLGMNVVVGDVRVRNPANPLAKDGKHLSRNFYIEHKDAHPESISVVRSTAPKAAGLGLSLDELRRVQRLGDAAMDRNTTGDLTTFNFRFPDCSIVVRGPEDNLTSVIVIQTISRNAPDETLRQGLETVAQLIVATTRQGSVQEVGQWLAKGGADAERSIGGLSVGWSTTAAKDGAVRLYSIERKSP